MAGSFKKNTQLKHTKEIDVFILFNHKKYAAGNASISDILEGKLKKLYRITRLHGSRDYFQLNAKQYVFEIIPILGITSYKQAKNITDISPLHAKWVSKHAKKLPDIRLAKAFLDAQGIYGAESYIRGFSGYAAEVLTIHYSSFLNLLRAATKWNPKQVIDPEKHYKSKNALLELNKSKISSLVLIDPVQPSRNVTAALSEESFNTFKDAAKKFLSKPSRKFFERQIPTRQQLISSIPKNCMLLTIKAVPEENKKDVMGAAILHKYETIRKELLSNRFKIKKSGWSWRKEAMLWFYISKQLPSKYTTIKGPSAKNEVHAARFRKKHSKAAEKHGRLYASVKTRFPTPKALVKHILRQENFKRKLKSAKAEWN